MCTDFLAGGHHIDILDIVIQIDHQYRLRRRFSERRKTVIEVSDLVGSHSRSSLKYDYRRIKLCNPREYGAAGTF